VSGGAIKRKGPNWEVVVDGKSGNLSGPENFVFLSVWGLIFGIFRHNVLYISSAREIFGHGNTKILFLT
jgi:hypothetical protein